MTLNKLTIHPDCGPEAGRRGIEVLFNPTSVSRQYAARWDAPPRLPSQEATATTPGRAQPDAGLQFVAIEHDQLSLDLFADTYEPRFRGSGGDADVRAHTDRVVGLTAIDTEEHRPPICRLAWGRRTLFVGVLRSVNLTFSLFLADGTPVRATMSCSFVQYRTQADRREGELHSADVDRTHVVADGDTLPGIAAACYGDPRRWRTIADANDVADPRRLETGRVLSVPRLRG